MFQLQCSVGEVGEERDDMFERLKKKKIKRSAIYSITAVVCHIIIFMRTYGMLFICGLSFRNEFDTKLIIHRTFSCILDKVC